MFSSDNGYRKSCMRCKKGKVEVSLWAILLKTGQTVTQMVKIQSVNLFILLFGYESLTSRVYINIRHKLTG